MTTFSDDAETLFDRERELATMRASIDEARTRAQSLLIRLSGPAGIGKTALLQTVIRLATRGRGLWVTAEPEDRTLPMATVRRLLGPSAPPSASEDAITALVRQMIAVQHITCIDDAQWLDEISRRIVVKALLDVAAPSIVLLGDRREEAPELPPHRTIRLGALRRSAAEKLVRLCFPGVSADALHDIVAASSGIPFAVHFLATHAAGRFGTTLTPGTTSFSVADAIANRLHHCSDRAREAIRHAAFIEPPVNIRRVAAACGTSLAHVSEALAELGDLAIVEDLYLRFRHATVAAGIAASVGDAVPYHTRLLSTFDPEDLRIESLAGRLHAAQGCGKDDAAAECALRLGRAVAASGSLETSLDYLEAALRHVPHPPPVAYAVEYAGVLQQLARDEKAAEFLREQIRNALDRADAAAAAELLVSFFSAALTLELFGELDSLCERVDRLATAHSESSQRVRSVRIAAQVFGATYGGSDVEPDPAVWVDHRPASFAAAVRGDDAAARASFELYQAGLRSEHARQRPTDRFLRALIALFETGTPALAGLDDDICSVRGHPTGAALALLRHVAEGRWDAARSLIARIPLWDAAYEEPYELLTLRLAFAALSRSAPAEPSRTLRSIRTLIGRSQVRHAISPARWFLASTVPREGPPPADITAFVRDTLRVPPMAYLFGALPLSIALLEPVVAPNARAEAIGHWPHFGSRWHRAHFELAAGLVFCDHSRLRLARDAFDGLNAPAFAVIAGLALPVPRARDVALARALGLREQPETVVPLTRRERDIAELAAAGKSNREIALALEISERTVEVHLTNAFRKLGIRSRSALASLLVRS